MTGLALFASGDATSDPARWKRVTPSEVNPVEG
jgi:hypothetical protein